MRSSPTSSILFSSVQAFLIVPMCLCAAIWFVALPHYAEAQGFNWQYSARFPTDYPTLFLGLQGGYSPYAQNSTRLQYKEPLASGGTCDCAEFTGALGQEWRIGVMAEKWFEPGNWALYGMLTLQQQSEKFRTLSKDTIKGIVNPDVYPNRGKLITEYVFENNATQTSLELGAKFKFYPLPLFLTLGIGAGYIVQFDNRLVEQIADTPSASGYNFPERNLRDEPLATSFFKFNPLSLAATARIGADVPLAKGLYATPAIFATYQFRSIGASTWTRLALGVHVSLLLGL